MAISTQRILILYIILGLLTQTALHIHQESTFSMAEYTYFIDETRTETDILKDSETYNSNPRTDIQTDHSNWLIDIFKAGGAVIKFFVKAMIPWNISPPDGNNNIEQIVIVMIQVMKYMMLSILGLEIISYWVNRKQP